MKRAMMLPLVVAFCAATALALCPGPRAAQWNASEGTCVEGFWGNYCQDTELVHDADCGGPNQTNLCYVSTTTLNKAKRVYRPKYSGECTLNQETNPCVDVTAPPIDQIPYHMSGVGLTSCP